jgi:ADP-heptose:LPS heptosyltransferase
MYRWKVIYFFSWLLSIFINRFKNPSKRTFKNILIIRQDEIGDMITSLPVLDALRARYPQAQITVWCSGLTRSLIEHHPAVDRVVVSRKELNPPYDLLIDLRGSLESLCYALVHPPCFRLDRGTVRFRNKFALPYHPHEVFTNLQVIQPLLDRSPDSPALNLYLAQEDYTVAEQFLQSHGISSFCLFHTGARRPLRRWPLVKFARLAVALKEQYGWDIVLTGTEDDRQDIEQLQKHISFKTYAFIGYSLRQLAALASRAVCFIGNESGPMHIAAAMKIPVIGLFGPGEPHTFSPFGPRATYLHHRLPCNPCDQIHCVQPHNPCINLIEVDEVLVKVKEVMCIQ